MEGPLSHPQILLKEGGLTDSLKKILQRISQLTELIKVQKGGSCKGIYNLRGSAIGLFLSQLRGRFLWIDRDEESAKRVLKDINFYRALLSLDCYLSTKSGGDIFLLPDGDDPLSEGIRSEIILKGTVGGTQGGTFVPPCETPTVTLPTSDVVGIIASQRCLDLNYWSPEELKRQSVFLKKGMEVERLRLVDSLINLGYRKSPVVINRGEFSVRNFIVEVFPASGENPLRIEFFGDVIETIRIFDPETQLSTGVIDQSLLLPVRPPDKDEAISFKELLSILGIRNWEIFLSEDLEVPTVTSPPGTVGGTQGGTKVPPCETPTVTSPLKDLLSEGFILSNHPFSLTSASFTSPLSGEVTVKGIDAGFMGLSGYGLLYNERKSIDELPERLKPLLKEKSILICTRTASQAKRLKEVCLDRDLIIPVLSVKDVINYKGNSAIIPETPSSGIHLGDFLLLTDSEIFGPKFSYRQPSGYRISKVLTEIDDLEEGDFVVHKIHGIGIYRGTKRLRIEDVEEDVLIIEYRDGALLYLPVRNISMIHKFRAQEGVVPTIDSLGGKTWKKTKERVKARIKEMAERLIKLYAEREIINGYAFSPDGEIHREFASFFEYEETPDQLKAIEEVTRDMEQPSPMERLIVGDVGYGKTEVAMRAAFKAVFDGKQVAVLVPTTLLAEQHLRTFRQRFSAFPVKIDYLSRLKPPAERKKTIEGIAKGEIDIIIGTHSLLSDKIRFFDLGLLIIDEEHRFGVRHKERLKELKKGVDVLILTATPIPRTLHMALSGLRAMSIIETPPEDRYAVKTVVCPFNEETIKRAIEEELKRDGQVFFIHNRIRDIDAIRALLERLIPGIRVAVAHGELKESVIEDVMLRFLKREIDVLVCTNIIGSGIDIPSANTIIINRAHEMGLADLYQLRGRVGRSNKRAYAYLLIPDKEPITETAKKRLEAICEMSYLGAGIRLAMTDLEIRGAGNLLGKEQSGHINTVGFELYVELLEKAIKELKGERIEEDVEPVIDIPLRASIPETYVEDIHLRLNLYRRLSMVRNDSELSEITKEMEDRFGPLPEETRNLVKVIELKNLLRRLHVERITVRDGGASISITISFAREMESLDPFLQIFSSQFSGEVTVGGLTGGNCVSPCVPPTVDLVQFHSISSKQIQLSTKAPAEEREEVCGNGGMVKVLYLLTGLFKKVMS